MNTKQRRIAGGRVPHQAMMAVYFFGRFALEEFKRYPYDIAAAASTPEGQSTLEGSSVKIEKARLSFNRMAQLCSISLPKEMTVPFPQSWRKADGSFDFVIERKVFSRLNAAMISPKEEDHIALRAAIEADDYHRIWSIMLGRHLGDSYMLIPSYKQLIANLATVAAGICYLIYANWGDSNRPGESAVLIENAQSIFDTCDASAINRIAIRTNASTGIVLAAVCALAGRKNSASVRAALSRKRDMEPLIRSLWEPLIPDYQRHPFFGLLKHKMEDPSFNGYVGRPTEVPLGPVKAPRPPLPDRGQSGLKEETTENKGGGEAPPITPISKASSDLPLIKDPTEKDENL